jgi:(5-formylfuran-3-yl)methyl phosphate synthase
MQLLISVAGPAEARAALRGGADVIDAKDPRRGALGPVSLQRLAAIRGAVAGARPLSAAVGDATSEEAVAGAVAAALSVGVAFVKVGFAGVTKEARARRLAVAARRAAETDVMTRLVLVAYADWRSVASLPPARVLAVAADTGAAGVLFDTATKHAPLFAVESPDAVAAWVAAAHAAGLFAALAGGLSGPDLARACSLGADVVGVRGAACVGGRTGRVSRARVVALRALADAAPSLRVPIGRGVLPQRDVELTEIVRRDDEVFHAVRERA